MNTQQAIIHKYILHEKLGKGCFSAVFKGTHKINNKVVAIKIESDGAPINMLKRESKILSYLYKELSPSNRWIIPTLFWYGMYGEHICMATTFYPTTLTQHISDIWISNKLNIIMDLAMISYQIIEIFQYIHATSIIHCDIKPDNFMMNNDGKVVLIDFGLANLYIDSPTSSSKKEHLIGSSKYASYFLHEGYSPAKRDDIISVGYLFFTIFKIDLPWFEKGLFTEPNDNSYPLYHIMHPHNIIRKNRKSPEYLFKYLQSNRHKVIKHYLFPYIENVYKLDIAEPPDYYYLKSIFTTLY
jgi:serine/threonine protein kinase